MAEDKKDQLSGKSGSVGASNTDQGNTGSNPIKEALGSGVTAEAYGGAQGGSHMGNDPASGSSDPFVGSDRVNAGGTGSAGLGAGSDVDAGGENGVDGIDASQNSGA